MAPGWPARLQDGPVGLRPWRVRDATAWLDLRLRNQDWLERWEGGPPSLRGLSWEDRHTLATYTTMLRALRREARAGRSLPFAVTYDGRLAGQLTVNNVVRGAFDCGAVGYWVDEAVAGRGVIPTALALAVDHCFTTVGLHRVEVSIRPENAASRRVVEKLGFRQEALHERYLFIDGAWRDHVGYALTVEEVPDGLLRRWRHTA